MFSSVNGKPPLASSSPGEIVVNLSSTAAIALSFDRLVSVLFIVKVVGNNEKVLGCFDSGDYFGEVAVLDGFGRSMAELELAEKNAISHRAQAFVKFREYLETMA